MSCIGVKITITIHEGGTFDQTFQWKAGEDVGTAVSVDLTGYTAEFTVREKLDSPNPLISITQATSVWMADGTSGVYFDDADEGKYRVYVKDEDTDNICLYHKDLLGVYDLFLYSPAGEAVLKQYGTCKIKAAVTR